MHNLRMKLSFHNSRTYVLTGLFVLTEIACDIPLFTDFCESLFVSWRIHSEPQFLTLNIYCRFESCRMTGNSPNHLALVMCLVETKYRLATLGLTLIRSIICSTVIFVMEVIEKQ